MLKRLLSHEGISIIVSLLLAVLTLGNLIWNRALIVEIQETANKNEQRLEKICHAALNQPCLVEKGDL